jgi:hypothetical protein
MLITRLSTLTDEDLVSRIESLARDERDATANLIAHLAELESRSLHLARGFKSLFGYCRHVLRCSEHESYNRMQAVHAARRFPVILPMLADGLLHLTAVRLLAPHLQDEDHLALLGGAIHKSKRDVVKLLAGWFPSADVSSTIRKLPSAPAADDCAAGPGAHSPDSTAQVAGAPAPALPNVVTRPASPGVVAPLSGDRYRLQVTLDEDGHADLRCLQDRLRREIPSGDAAVIVARALKMMRQAAEKQAFAATSRPQAPRPASAASRHIPAHVERAVWQRDEGQCSFEGPHHRCEERSSLEFHHLTPWITGGEPSIVNIALRCRAHNAYESAVYFAPIRAAMEERLTSPAP